VIGSSQRPLPDNTQHSQQTNIHAAGGIRTHNLSRRTAQTYALEREATGTGISRITGLYKLDWEQEQTCRSNDYATDWMTE